MTYTFDITPISKPRMVKSDAWRKRKCVLEYWKFKDKLVNLAKKIKFEIPESGAHLIFNLPMPKSWSRGKKMRMAGLPHKSKPDVDNIIKSIFDCLCESDAHIWDCRASKYWADCGSIEIRIG